MLDDWNLVGAFHIALSSLSHRRVARLIELVSELLVVLDGRIWPLMLTSNSHRSRVLQLYLVAAIGRDGALRCLDLSLVHWRVELLLLAHDVLIHAFLHLPWEWHSSSVVTFGLLVDSSTFRLRCLNFLNWCPWESRNSAEMVVFSIWETRLDVGCVLLTSVMLVEKGVNLKALRFQIGQVDVLPKARVLVRLPFCHPLLRILLLVWRALMIGALARSVPGKSVVLLRNVVGSSPWPWVVFVNLNWLITVMWQFILNQAVFVQVHSCDLLVQVGWILKHLLDWIVPQEQFVSFPRWILYLGLCSVLTRGIHSSEPSILIPWVVWPPLGIDSLLSEALCLESPPLLALGDNCIGWHRPQSMVAEHLVCTHRRLSDILVISLNDLTLLHIILWDGRCRISIISPWPHLLDLENVSNMLLRLGVVTCVEICVRFLVLLIYPTIRFHTLLVRIGVYNLIGYRKWSLRMLEVETDIRVQIRTRSTVVQVFIREVFHVANWNLIWVDNNIFRVKPGSVSRVVRSIWALHSAVRAFGPSIWLCASSLVPASCPFGHVLCLMFHILFILSLYSYS